MRSGSPLLGLFGLLVSCAASEEPIGVDMSGRTFVSESVEGRELVPGTEIRLGFGESELSAQAGCNSMSGAYRFDGYALIVSPMSMTEIGCDAPRHDQDEWLAAFLMGRPTASLTEPRLKLWSTTETLILLDREVGSPDKPLTGTHWIGTGIGDDIAVLGGPGLSMVTIDFGADGRVEAFSGCQMGSGTFTSNEATIAFTELAFDGEPCTDPNLERISDQVLLILDESEVSYRIEERELRISGAGLTLYLTASD